MAALYRDGSPGRDKESGVFHKLARVEIPKGMTYIA